MDASSQIDAYLASLDGWQRDTAARLRQLIHAADPDIVEAAIDLRAGDELDEAAFRDLVRAAAGLP